MKCSSYKIVHIPKECQLHITFVTKRITNPTGHHAHYSLFFIHRLDWENKIENWENIGEFRIENESCNQTQNRARKTPAIAFIFVCKPCSLVPAYSSQICLVSLFYVCNKEVSMSYSQGCELISWYYSKYIILTVLWMLVVFLKCFLLFSCIILNYQRMLYGFGWVPMCNLVRSDSSSITHLMVL
jgi:hypothetical protein